MAGSLVSAWVLDGSPIRRASVLNCVCLIREDRASETQLGASETAEELNLADRQLQLSA